MAAWATSNVAEGSTRTLARCQHRAMLRRWTGRCHSEASCERRTDRCQMIPALP